MKLRVTLNVSAALLLAACTSAAVPSASVVPSASAIPGPSLVPSPTVIPAPPSPPPTGAPVVDSAARAAALVLASEPLFANVSPLSPELIGGCCWYEVTPSTTEPGYLVSVTIGWGDCFAGCIDRHTWTYHVSPAGDLSLTGESGSAPPPDVVPGGSGPATITVHLVAGPTCPVETNPPDPNCAPRPVGNAGLIVRDQHGAELARAKSTADGSATMQLPAGTYILEALPAEGLMGTPQPVALSVTEGGFADVFLAYDTGIR